MEFFLAANECIENGKKITREDWNGRGQYVYYTPGRKIPVSQWDSRGNIPLTDHERMAGYVDVQGHMDMYNAQGQRVIGWAPTQTDLMSDKWKVVE